MKVLYISLFMLILSAGLYFYMDAKVPESVPEKIQVKFMEAVLKAHGHFAGILVMSGITEPFSTFLKSSGSFLYALFVTGSMYPWITDHDKNLQMSDVVMNGVSVRMFEPVSTLGQNSRPILIYFHGGGWTFSSVRDYEAFTRRLASSSGVVVVSVEYRLSPQNPYPAPLEDCANVAKYVIDNSERLSIDKSRIAIGGDSAGGNLAASISLRPEMQGKIAMQMLLVPVLQAVNFNTVGFIENMPYLSKSMNDPLSIMFVLNYLDIDYSSYEAFATNNQTSAKFKNSKYKYLFDQRNLLPKRFIRTPSLLTKQASNLNIGNETLFNEIEGKLTNPFIWPLLADDDQLTSLPFTYVMTCGYDIIRDDGIMFAERLKLVGNPVEHAHFDDGFHNALVLFDGPVQVDVGKRIVKDIIKVLRKL